MSFVEKKRKRKKKRKRGSERDPSYPFDLLDRFECNKRGDRETSIVKKLCSIVLLSVGRGAWGKFFLFSGKGRN